jgi:hypothetical protein
MRAMLAIVAVLTACAAAPAAAGAASVDPLAPCYRSVDQAHRELVPVYGHGFTPGAVVDVSVDGAAPVTATADQQGDVTGTVNAPYQARGERPFAVTVREPNLPANTARAQSRVAALDVHLKPSSARPSSQVRFLGRGFTDGLEIYAHYVRAGKLRRTVLLGAPEGACGRLDVRRRQIPIHKPRTGRWTLQVDTLREYSSAPATAFVRLAITVRRIVGGP